MSDTNSNTENQATALNDKEPKQILFLDFDGVLKLGFDAMGRPHESIRRIEDFLVSHESVEVVFATTWRNKYSSQELASLFEPSVRHRFIDSTPNVNSWSQKGTRQREIEAWIDMARINSYEEYKSVVWVALDDRGDLFEDNYYNLILVNNNGCNYILDHDVQRVENLLLEQLGKLQQLNGIAHGNAGPAQTIKPD